MQILVPKVSATFHWKGSVRHFVRGRTMIEEGHPILKGREHLVEPLRIDYPLPEKKSSSKTDSGKPKKS